MNFIRDRLYFVSSVVLLALLIGGAVYLQNVHEDTEMPSDESTAGNAGAVVQTPAVPDVQTAPSSATVLPASDAASSSAPAISPTPAPAPSVQRSRGDDEGGYDE